jgi:membrane dipeptidase
MIGRISTERSIEERIDALHADGLIDMHFDLPLGLQWKGADANIIAKEFLPEFVTGDIGVLGVATYVEDRYLPDRGLDTALTQIARLYAGVKRAGRLAICKTYEEICRARESGHIVLLLTMEGAEPLGTNLDLLRIFYELGLRAISLTHARRNAAACGGIFAAKGSPKEGLSPFGRELVCECEALGIMIDLAHINPAGFDEVCGLTSKPLIVSHTNARRYYDVERNISDEQIKMIGARGGVIGINAILVSPDKVEATLDRYIDHIEHVVDLIGIDGVGIGFDFCEFLWREMSDAAREELEAKLTTPHFLADLTNHSHARNLTRRLIDRGWKDGAIKKLLRGNWMRILEELL